jgi:N-acetylmuramoyl-L-alanine amidase
VRKAPFAKEDKFTNPEAFFAKADSSGTGVTGCTVQIGSGIWTPTAMKTHHRFFRASLSIAAVLFAALGRISAEDTFAWEARQIEDREYLSVDQIQKFYQFQKANRSDQGITLETSKVSLKIAIGSSNCFLNGIKFVFGNPVREVDGKAYVSRRDLTELLDPTLRPSQISKTGNFKTIILDPAESGTAGEADVTLQIANSIKERLKAGDFKFVMTRDGKTSPTPSQRLALANAVSENAIFISISVNPPADTERGIMTSPLSVTGGNPEATRFGPASVALSAAVHGSVIRRLGKNTVDRGIQRADGVLSDVSHAAVLMMVGTPSDPYEAKLIVNPAYQDAIASGIADGISKFRHATKAESSKD